MRSFRRLYVVQHLEGESAFVVFGFLWDADYHLNAPPAACWDKFRR
jgi:hypothetical protein